MKRWSWPGSALVCVAVASTVCLPLSAAVAADSPVLDTRYQIAGSAEERVTWEDGRPSQVTTVVHLAGGPSFPVSTNSPVYVSADRSRVLVAGGQFDPLTFRRGGEALLYDGTGKLLRRLMSFEGAWMGPQPVVGIEPSGGVWIAADGRLSRFDRDGSLSWTRQLPGEPMAMTFSPSAGRVALTLNTAAPSSGGAVPPALLFAASGRVLEAKYPADIIHAVEFTDEDTLLAVSHSRWMLLRRGANGELSIEQSGEIGGNLLGPFSVSVSPRGWFTLALAVHEHALVRVIEASTGRLLIEKRYPGETYTAFRRIVCIDDSKVRVFLHDREYTFDVP